MKIFLLFTLLLLSFQENNIEITNPLTDICDLTQHGLRCCNTVCELIELSKIPVCETKTYHCNKIRECCNMKKINDITIKTNCFTVIKTDQECMKEQEEREKKNPYGNEFALF
jgi:hypothetical protein